MSQNAGKRPLEGWSVRERPAVIAGLAVSLTLLALVVGGVTLYNRYVREHVAFSTERFAEPRLERRSLAPAEITRRAERPSEKPDVGRAMREIVEEGAR
ncbi:hypothetical protein [Hansschlegelia sp.]|uniref:hypothetical protein n=1 Tax=Hansschlegelia sp. TaxID=2041892 RepID=UPI002BEB5DF5|nr:hypothetical protein [Hansschlegelia sp.]HVI30133.1 hypothetical protein [Hansschlegelia sp.]